MADYDDVCLGCGGPRGRLGGCLTWECAYYVGCDAEICTECDEPLGDSMECVNSDCPDCVTFYETEDEV
jgi:hypothetical protein